MRSALTQSLSKMLLGRVLTVFSLRPAREDFLGNLVVSTYYKDSAPVRIPSRVLSFVDSVSASLTRCKTRAAVPRGKNRLVELGPAWRYHSPACTCSDLGRTTSQWAGECAVICSPLPSLSPQGGERVAEGRERGRFMESPLPFFRMHWDHEPDRADLTSAASRSVTA